jgi:hypothetical protein
MTSSSEKLDMPKGFLSGSLEDCKDSGKRRIASVGITATSSLTGLPIKLRQSAKQTRSSWNLGCQALKVKLRFYNQIITSVAEDFDLGNPTFRLLPTLGFGALCLCALAAVHSGLDWPANYRLETAVWPWKTGWFMFHSHDGWNHQLVVSATTSQRQEILLDLDTLFPYRVSQHSRRYNEISRNTKSIMQLADYICAHYRILPSQPELNPAEPGASVPLAPRLNSLTFYDLTWPAHPRAGPSIANSNPRDVQKKIYLQNFACEV